MGLKEYNKKRNFNSTIEPKGKIEKSKLRRFVIQFHRARRDHYDLRLEHNGVLLSWAVPKGLSADENVRRLAVKVEDHPIDYINFEGEIPKGNYGAGTVEIFDKGEYLPIKSISKGLKQGQIKFILNGEKLCGAWTLVKAEENNWIAIKIDDKYAIEFLNEKLKGLKVNERD